MSSRGSSVIVTRTISLGASAADAWPMLTDTDRMNRLVFRANNEYRAIEGDASTSARFVVKTKVAGFLLEYEESPFEWTLHKSFSVFRRMRTGPLHSYTFSMKLDPSPDAGTRVTIRLELQPRHWVFRPIAQLTGNRIVGEMAKLCESVDAHLRDNAPSPYLRPASPVDESRLAHAASELGKRGLDPNVVRTIVELVRSGPDADLVRIRPFELARERGLDGRETVRGFLHATTLGIVELRWALICPSCRTANDQVTSLADIGDSGHCQLCDLAYGIELDRAVEATFVPHPSVREVSNQMFCVGGPWRTPHVVVQAVVPAGAATELDAPAEPGRYRLFARGGALLSLAVEADGPPSTSTALSPEAPSSPLRGAGSASGTPQFDATDLRVAAGGRVVVTNHGSADLHVKIERLAYATLAATAHYVTTLSEFRRFFSRDLLKPSTPLKVASCALLFSDLTGSTALYTKAGDAAAFRLVDDHFDVLRKVIDELGGAVVKTMGDAVMAAFSEPLACVRAATACLHAFEKFRVDTENGELTSIKLGLFAGPCYVVTANDAIDYFGQTVNCASRVQHVAGPGELVFEESVYDRLPPADAALLQVVERVETRVKGVDEPLKLVRTKLATEVVSERTLSKQPGKPGASAVAS